ncbi:hypothetical protein [Streptomyces buecherae]
MASARVLPHPGGVPEPAALEIGQAAELGVGEGTLREAGHLVR